MSLLGEYDEKVGLVSSYGLLFIDYRVLEIFGSGGFPAGNITGEGRGWSANSILALLRQRQNYFGFLIFHTRVDRDPVYLPRLSSIIRERLFKTARCRSDV